MKRYATLLVGLFCVVTVAGCFGPTQEPVYSVAPPQWLIGTWETPFSLMTVYVTHDNVIIDTYDGFHMNLRDLPGSVTDESPSNIYYKIYHRGDMLWSFLDADSFVRFGFGGDHLTLTRI